MTIARALVTGLLLLSACSAPAPSAPVPSAPSASPATAAPPTAIGPARTTGTPAAPPSSYTGPLPLPAGDGKPMLWPAPTEVSVGSGEFGATIRYGFVDANGVLVVPPRYEGYEYCRDDAGRVASVVVTAAGRKAAVLDLAGTVVRTLPTDTAACGPAGTVMFTHEIDMAGSNWQDGLLEAATGRVLLPLAPKRHIRVVDDRTVNVSGSGREYFLDVITGQRTPHPGEVTEAGREPGAPGVPAVATGPGGKRLTGFVDAAGRWTVAPGFTDAYEFVQGIAVVELAEGGFTFLDAHGQRVGGEWAEVEQAAFEEAGGWQVVGYLVTGPEGQGLLALDLRTVVEPGPAKITCDSEAGGACAVVAPDGHASLVQMPQGTVTAMPDGFDQAVGPVFLGGGAEDEAGWITRILAIGTGLVTDLGGGYYCRGIGTAWAACSDPDPAVLPPVVLDAQGRWTAFRTMAPLYGADRPAEVAYYWATTARWEGIVDADGTWHYRQSRFTRLED